jgi:hypothetical protein
MFKATNADGPVGDQTLSVLSQRYVPLLKIMCAGRKNQSSVAIERPKRRPLIDKIMLARMHDQDRAWSMSGNLLGIATGHQPFKPGVVMRRYHNQVRLQQCGHLDYM